MCISLFSQGKKDHSVIVFMCLNKKGDAIVASPLAIWSLDSYFESSFFSAFLA